MELHGSLVVNLEAAISSAKRLRSQRIYPETLAYWEELPELARRIAANGIDPDSQRIASLANQLEIEIQSLREPGTVR